MTRPYNNQQQKKRTCRIVDFAVPADHREKMKESEKKDLSRPSKGIEKKTMEHEGDSYTNCCWCSWYCHKRIDRGTRGLGNKRPSGDNPNYCITEIGQNTEKSSGDLRRLVTQTPVKDHQSTLM